LHGNGREVVRIRSQGSGLRPARFDTAVRGAALEAGGRLC